MPACPLPADEALRQRTLDDMNLVDTPAEHYLDTLVRLTQDLAHVDTVLISLIDQDRQWFKARVGLEATETKRDVSFCGYAILGDETLMVPDAKRDSRFDDNPLVLCEFAQWSGDILHSPHGLRVRDHGFCVNDRPVKTSQQAEDVESALRIV